MGVRSGQTQRCVHTLGARMAPHERPDANAVDRGDLGQVDDQMGMACPQELLDLLLQRLGSPSGNQGLARRKQDWPQRESRVSKYLVGYRGELYNAEDVRTAAHTRRA